MVRTREMTLSLPKFTPMVIWLLAINTGIFLLLELFSLSLPDLSRWISHHLSLEPEAVIHGAVWQLVTYGFLHFQFWHWFGNMLALWMFGSTLEDAWGARRFLSLYSCGIIGAALTTVVLAYTHALGSPESLTVGASGGVFALLIAFGMVFSENEIMMIPFPISLKAKYFIAILIVVELALALNGGGDVAYVAHLGGLFFGFLYVKFFSRRKVSAGISERYFGIRNGYYRWKRKRAARKFEVYMSKHDRKVTFDENGNYIPPDDDKKNGGDGKSGWVN